MVDPASQALSVSNHVSTDGSLGPEVAAFDAVSSDRDAFRFEVENPVSDDPVSVALTIADRLPILYNLDARSGNRYRSHFLRLVGDGEDVSALGVLNQQNVLAQIGDDVIIRYEPGTGCADRHRIRVCRPASEQNNDHPNQSRHDVRYLPLRITVFSRPGRATLASAVSDSDQTLRLPSVADIQPSGHVLIGSGDGGELVHYAGTNAGAGELTGCIRGVAGTAPIAHAAGAPVVYSSTTPSASKTDIEADLTSVNERFAQSGIKVRRPVTIDLGGAGSSGRVLPPAVLAGYRFPSVFDVPNQEPPTDSEQAVIALRSLEPNLIEIFYVDHMYKIDDSAQAPQHGYSRPALINNSADPRAQNFAVVSSARKVLTVAHEIMHLLLNDGHRVGDPRTALFNESTTDSKAPDSTKRIGPYPDATAAGVGVFDTSKIRASAETLPG
ncbi:hypothetical protein FB388_1280 [Pseudonocardia cypriaca]|uniref:Uncharacterized protein n=1 Tax=Pseudonocardia cypriaca TaxID=882449 RepID=A0A543GCW6_9PSEU|nr:hypothetical protein FB388_1280 [Pseudonocardia cypriaca]